MLERLQKRVFRVHPEMVKTLVLHHDNAHCYAAFSVSQFLASNGIASLPQPPYSPDMSLCDFFTFSHMKKFVKCQHFYSVEDIQETVTRVLGEVLREVFQNCYETWKTRWNKCIGAVGDYFEGDRSDVPYFLNILDFLILSHYIIVRPRIYIDK